MFAFLGTTVAPEFKVISSGIMSAFKYLVGVAFTRVFSNICFFFFDFSMEKLGNASPGKQPCPSLSISGNYLKEFGGNCIFQVCFQYQK